MPTVIVSVIAVSVIGSVAATPFFCSVACVISPDCVFAGSIATSMLVIVTGCGSVSAIVNAADALPSHSTSPIDSVVVETS